MRVTDLAVYPVKALRSTSVSTCAVTPLGLDGDRRWMLADDTGRFLTQREMPELATWGAEPAEDGGLVFSFPGGGMHRVGSPDPAHRLRVQIWASSVDATLASRADNEALSERAGRPVSLVFFDETASRPLDRDFANGHTAFADGYPVLVTTEASLAALNEDIRERGSAAAGMERFRPNIVLDGEVPWAEDGWASIRIGDAVFDLVKPCSRCVVTTTDQKSGARPSDEPLATLARTRRSADRRVKGALFGWNAVPRGEGRLTVGDEVRVLDVREPWSIAASIF